MLVNQTMTQRHCTHSEAWRITSAAHPGAAILMSAAGRSRKTVQFFNAREAQKSTPAKTAAKKQFQQFVNAKEQAGLHPTAAYNAAASEHPDLVATMAGAARAQFVNDATAAGTTPVGSPGFKALFWLPASCTQEQWAAAWIGNGSTAIPLNPAKIFAALVELAQKQTSSLDYNGAIARCKSDFPDLWNAVELLSKEPV